MTLTLRSSSPRNRSSFREWLSFLPRLIPDCLQSKRSSMTMNHTQADEQIGGWAWKSQCLSRFSRIAEAFSGEGQASTYSDSSRCLPSCRLLPLPNLPASPSPSDEGRPRPAIRLHSLFCSLISQSSLLTLGRLSLLSRIKPERSTILSSVGEMGERTSTERCVNEGCGPPAWLLEEEAGEE